MKNDRYLLVIKSRAFVLGGGGGLKGNIFGTGMGIFLGELTVVFARSCHL